MLINCYYYAPHNHSLLADHLDWDLELMAKLGTDIVSVCVAESHLRNWHGPRLQRVVNRIHAHGMKTHAVPNRWAGLVAGWMDGFGDFTADHPETRIQDAQGRIKPNCERPSCVNHPLVRAHFEQTLDQLLTKFDFDGLIWDEPHGSDPCFCQYCNSQRNTAPAQSWYQSRFAAFLDQCSQYAKCQRQNLVVSVFVQPDQDDLLRQLLQTQHIDYIGSDGHIRSEEHLMHRMKVTIFDAYAKYYPQLRAAGKKTLFLLEAQRHRDEDLDDYLVNLERAFALPMDHLMYYFCAQEMLTPAKEKIFVEATWKAVSALKERGR